MTLLICWGCGTGSDDTESGQGAATAGGPAVVEPTTLAFTPGGERLIQHQRGTSDIAATEKISVDFQNAYWLARLAAISESKPDDVRTQLQQIGLPWDDNHVRFYENTCTDTQAFYVTTADLSQPPETIDNPFRTTSHSFAALVFRGTEPTSWKDIATDLAAWDRPGVSPLGNPHAGFAHALDSVWMTPDAACGVTDPIQPFLLAHHDFDFVDRPAPIRKGAELYFVGHSLGGALATLALAKTVTDPCAEADPNACGEKKFIPVSGLYTYGAPRPFDRAFANSLAEIMQDRTPIMRYVHDSDGVPFVPGAPFAHPGFDGDEVDFQIVLEADRAIVAEPVDRFKMSSTLATDHHIRTYLPVLAARIGGH